jgi:hypothetical protein
VGNHAKTLINIDGYVSKEEHDMLLEKYKHLEFQLTELRRLIFGSKSERFIPLQPNQLGLFTEQTVEENITKTLDVQD